MAWGFWNKIKKGFQKVGKAIKKGAKWISDKIIKPFKPVIKGVAGAFVPAVGSQVAEAVMDGIDAVGNAGAKGAVAWGKQHLK